MHNYGCILLVCILYIGGVMGCRMLVEVDSNQGWKLFGKFIIRVGGNEFLAATSVVSEKLVLNEVSGPKSLWSYRDGMITNLFHKQVVTVDSNFLVLTEPADPPTPSQVFEYVNGTLWNRETDLYLTGWGKNQTATLEEKGGGCKQRQVTYLMNEQWSLVGTQVMSALTGLVLTRKEGVSEVYALPYNATDKSLHQDWYFGLGKFRNADFILTALPSGQGVAEVYEIGKNFDQLFYMANGFIRNLKSKMAMYIPKDGSSIRFRKEHVFF
ncbi:hypothetical protein LOD99_10102 [Oopsacas minuta]|uniref:Uncharacterized protein n=1 Tax=Oopsacas minuta TaxID=111878 RepID=A0AAV7KIP2_9METZ|nr:hypothetical protein LOD99_10102 [Oopsacas minuta]